MMHSQAAILPMMKKGKVYLLRDEFITDDPAPIASPRTCEPGPGTAVIVDTSNRLSVAGGVLSIAIGVAAADYKSNDAYAHAAGLCAYIDIPSSVGGYTYFHFGLDGASPRTEVITGNDTYIRPLAVNPATNVKLPGIGRNYLIARSDGGTFYVLANKLAWVDNATNVVSRKLYCLLAAVNGKSGSVDNATIVQLTTPWTTSYGPGSAITGAIVAPQAFTHEANFLGYFTVTNRGTAGNTDYRFRQQDATNYWQLLIVSDGSGVLNEVVAGVPTSRGSFAAGTVTNGERVCVQANSTTIQVMEAGNNRITYAGAVNFQAATSGQLAGIATDGVITTIETYPIDLSGAALAALAAV